MWVTFFAVIGMMTVAFAIILFLVIAGVRWAERRGIDLFGGDYEEHVPTHGPRR